jgi:hypothetical protein
VAPDRERLCDNCGQPFAPEGAPRQGTWRSPGFRSAKTRSRWAISLLAISGGFAALGVIALLVLYAQVNNYADGQATFDQLAHTWNVAHGFLGCVMLLAVPTAIALLAWLSRSVENAPPLWAGTPTTSPRWAIGWWFVPIIWFVKPYQIVRDLHARLALPGAQGGTGFVLGWWLASALSVLVFLPLQYLSATLAVGTGDEAMSALRAHILLIAAGDLLLVVSAWLGALVVREIQHRANLRAERLGLAAPEAVWPTVNPLAPSASGNPQGSPAGTTPTTQPMVDVPDPATSAQTDTPVLSIAPASPQSPAVAPSPVEALATLAEMRDRGLITSADYEAKKAELLSRF